MNGWNLEQASFRVNQVSTIWKKKSNNGPILQKSYTHKKSNDKLTESFITKKSNPDIINTPTSTTTSIQNLHPMENEEKEKITKRNNEEKSKAPFQIQW